MSESEEDKNFEVAMSTIYDFLSGYFSTSEEVVAFISWTTNFEVIPKPITDLIEEHYDPSEMPRVIFEKEFTNINLLKYIVPAMFPEDFYQAYMVLRVELLGLVMNAKKVLSCVKNIKGYIENVNSLAIEAKELNFFSSIEGSLEEKKRASKAYVIDEKIQAQANINSISTYERTIESNIWFLENVMQNIETFMNAIHSSKFDYMNSSTRYDTNLKSLIVSFARMLKHINKDSEVESGTEIVDPRKNTPIIQL